MMELLDYSSADLKLLFMRVTLQVTSPVCVCVAVLEAVHRWKTERESRVSGEQQQEEEEEESIYTVYNEEVNCLFTCSANQLLSGDLGTPESGSLVETHRLV